MKVTSGPSFEVDILGHSITILWHGIFIGIGFLAGLILSLQMRQRYGYTIQQCLHMAVLTAVGGFWGARFFYCWTHWTSFVKNCRAWETRPAVQLFIPTRGLTLQGGMLGIILASYLYCRWKNLSFARMADFGVAPMSLGVCFGRIGCLLNGCCFGKVMETAIAAAESTSSSVWSRWFYQLLSAEYLLSAYPKMSWIQRHRPIRVTLQHDEHGELIHTHPHTKSSSGFTDPLYATQLYAAVGNLLLCIIIYQIGRKQWLPVHGQLFAVYLNLYSFLRLFVELYRDRPMPSDQIFTSRAWRNIYEVHIVCLLFILCGSFYLLRTRHALFAKTQQTEKEKKTT